MQELSNLLAIIGGVLAIIITIFEVLEKVKKISEKWEHFNDKTRKNIYLGLLLLSWAGGFVFQFYFYIPGIIEPYKSQIDSLEKIIDSSEATISFHDSAIDTLALTKKVHTLEDSIKDLHVFIKASEDTNKHLLKEINKLNEQIKKNEKAINQHYTVIIKYQGKENQRIKSLKNFLKKENFKSDEISLNTVDENSCFYYSNDGNAKNRADYIAKFINESILPDNAKELSSSFRNKPNWKYKIQITIKD